MEPRLCPEQDRHLPCPKLRCFAPCARLEGCRRPRPGWVEAKKGGPPCWTSEQKRLFSRLEYGIHIPSERRPVGVGEGLRGAPRAWGFWGSGFRAESRTLPIARATTRREAALEAALPAPCFRKAPPWQRDHQSTAKALRPEILEPHSDSARVSCRASIRPSTCRSPKAFQTPCDSRFRRHRHRKALMLECCSPQSFSQSSRFCQGSGALPAGLCGAPGRQRRVPAGGAERCAPGPRQRAGGSLGR